MQLLLSNGIDPNRANGAGDTPLQVCVRTSGHMEHAKLLLRQRQIDVDVTSVHDKATVEEIADGNKRDDFLQLVDSTSCLKAFINVDL